MPILRRLLSRRFLLADLGVAVIIFASSMLHPYPRQSLFGPTIRGKPRYFWEGQIRRIVQPESNLDKALAWLGIEEHGMPLDELFNDPEMAPLVVEMLDEDNYHLRGHLMGQILNWPLLQDPAALPVLRRRLRDGDVHQRILAARCIWLIDKDKAMIAVFVELLISSDPGLRGVGVNHIATVPDAPELFPHLAALKNDANDRVRGPVMFAMQHYGQKGVPILIEGLNDPSRDVRENAAASLCTLGKQAADAAPALEARLNDVDPVVRNVAIFALQAIDREKYKHLKGVLK